jgi:transmembrane sensor
MADLDKRLQRGALRVESLYQLEPAASASRRVLQRRRRRALTIGLLSLSACALLGGSLALRSADGPHHARSAQLARVAAPVVRSGEQPRASIAFADGSFAEPHGAASTLATEELSPSRVRVRLVGGARFEVTPRASRTFEVHTQQLVVRVLGTAFSIDPEGSRTRVQVERGRVQVSWREGSAILGAGELGTFPPLPDPAARGEVLRAGRSAEGHSLAHTPQAVLGESSEPGPSSLTDQRSQSPSPDEQPAAEHGAEPSRRAILPARRAHGTSTRTAAHASEDSRLARPRATRGPRTAGADEPAELLLAADVARLDGQPQRAVELLRKLCARFPHDRRAPVAAFTLGRVLLDDLGRLEEAAIAFEQASALWPSGPLAESALARAVDAYERSGRVERAESLAKLSLSRFPRGRYAHDMRSRRAP